MRVRNLIPILALGGLLCACGAGAPASHAPGSTTNPTKGATTPKTSSGRSNEASGAQQAAAVETAGSAPCTLVTREQASAILGERISKPSEAVQGPTCVYKGHKSFVTLAVQTLDFDKIKPKLGLRQRVEVSSKVAYCGNYGQQMLYVPLSEGRVLSVAAPCPRAKRFAALAVRALSG
jgi:hypothetical protein